MAKKTAPKILKSKEAASALPGLKGSGVKERARERKREEEKFERFFGKARSNR